eukprot:m.1607667 g.1607667  ORF g.1607667 m.1607667 type:complete len:50 (+) comp25362_c0_seq10:2195-2344(+)
MWSHSKSYSTIPTSVSEIHEVRHHERAWSQLINTVIMVQCRGGHHGSMP